MIGSAASILALAAAFAAGPVAAQQNGSPANPDADLSVPAPPADADLPEIEPVIGDEEFESAVPALDDDTELEGPLESIADFERRIAAEQADADPEEGQEALSSQALLPSSLRRLPHLAQDVGLS